MAENRLFYTAENYLPRFQLLTKSLLVSVNCLVYSSLAFISLKSPDFGFGNFGISDSVLFFCFAFSSFFFVLPFLYSFIPILLRGDLVLPFGMTY